MSGINQLDLCRAYLQSATDSVKPIDKGGKTEGPVVTISREAGARGNTIAEAVVEKLRSERSIPRRHPWTLFNQNLIQCVIEEHSLPETTAGYLGEQGAGDISLMVAELLGLHPGVYNTVRRTAETIRRIARAGNAVIVGRGGNIITADIAHAIHVRLVGSKQIRSNHYAAHADIPHAKAIAEIARIDRARKRYLKTHYQTDITDPLRYDLVLNTDRISDDEAAEIIVTALAMRMEA
jgi:cytidylate kinase